MKRTKVFDSEFSQNELPGFSFAPGFTFANAWPQGGGRARLVCSSDCERTSREARVLSAARFSGNDLLKLSQTIIASSAIQVQPDDRQEFSA